MITYKYLLKNIHEEHIEDGLGHTEMLLGKGEKITGCVTAGIAIAEGQSRRYNFRMIAA